MRGKDYLPVSEMESSIIATVSRATFPIASGPKRFIGDLRAGRKLRLSDGGRKYLAWIANRFRRQYDLNAEQLQWVAEHIYEGEIVKARCEK